MSEPNGINLSIQQKPQETNEILMAFSRDRKSVSLRNMSSLETVMGHAESAHMHDSLNKARA